MTKTEEDPRRFQKKVIASARKNFPTDPAERSCYSCKKISEIGVKMCWVFGFTYHINCQPKERS